MIHPGKKVRTLSEQWNNVHLTIVYRSLFLATIIFALFLFFSGPTPSMTIERKILLHIVAYFAFFVVAELIHYIFFYIPNYIFYKRMMKAGREKEVQSMINMHGLDKLIVNDWFIFKQKLKHGKRRKNPPNKSDKG